MHVLVCCHRIAWWLFLKPFSSCMCDFRASWWSCSVARCCVPGTSDPTWPQYMSAEVPSKILAALWATRTQDPVSPFDFRWGCCRVQPSAHSQWSRTGQTDWRSSAADEQVDSWVEPHIARAVSTEIHVWSAVVEMAPRQIWQLFVSLLASFFS